MAESWRVTINQRTLSGAAERHETVVDAERMSDAVEEAIDLAGLIHANAGEYQITAARVDHG